jgi:outer membrane usher protein
LQGQLFASIARFISVSGGYLRRDARTEPSTRAVTTSLNFRLGGRAVLTAGGTYSLLSDRQYGFSMALIVPLGEREIATATSEVSNTVKSASAEYNRQLPLGPGYGYRFKTAQLDYPRNDGAFYYQDMKGTYGSELSQGSGQTGLRLLRRGSLVLLRNHLFMSQWLNDSFGVIQVTGTKDVPVYVNNLLLAKTGVGGWALVPWLVPYNENRIRLDDTVLPIEVSLDDIEQTVVPMPRTAVFLRYKPATFGGTLLTLNIDKDTPVPVGASVTLNGASTTYTVANRGEVFIPDMVYPAVVEAHWGSQSCHVRIEQSRSTEVIPRIGPLFCDTEAPQ